MAASMMNIAKFNSGPLPEKYPAAPEMTMMTKKMGNNLNVMSCLNKPGVVDLVHNCDLPPPVKLLSWPENTGEMIGYDDKVELLRALRSSQTRAREAERRSAALVEEKDRLETTLVEDSMRLFGYRQLVRLLEVRVKVLRSQWRFRPDMRPVRHFSSEPDAGSAWWFAVVLAVGLGVAGVGLALCGKNLYFR